MEYSYIKEISSNITEDNYINNSYQIAIEDINCACIAIDYAKDRIKGKLDTEVVLETKSTTWDRVGYTSTLDIVNFYKTKCAIKYIIQAEDSTLFTIIFAPGGHIITLTLKTNNNRILEEFLSLVDKNLSLFDSAERS